MNLHSLLTHAVEAGASDVHLKFDQPPVFRRDGALAPIEQWPALEAKQLDSVLATVTAGNTVVGQAPAAGPIVLDTGAPLVTLTLEKNPAYAQLDTSDNAAPYRGTAVRLPANPLARRTVPARPASRRPSASR